MPVFKTGAFDRSATSPAAGILTLFGVEPGTQAEAREGWDGACGTSSSRRDDACRPPPAASVRTLDRELPEAGFQDRCIRPLCHLSGGHGF